MNTLTKTFLTGALLTAVIAGTSANAGRAELSTIANNVIVSSDQKIYSANALQGMAKQTVSYVDNSFEIKKASFNTPVADLNRGPSR